MGGNLSKFQYTDVNMLITKISIKAFQIIFANYTHNTINTYDQIKQKNDSILFQCRRRKRFYATTSVFAIDVQICRFFSSRNMRVNEGSITNDFHEN